MQQLTGRQRQVAQLLAQGKTMQQIADTLNISVHTAKSYKNRAMQSAGVGTRIELAIKAAVDAKTKK